MNYSTCGIQGVSNHSLQQSIPEQLSPYVFNRNQICHIQLHSSLSVMDCQSPLFPRFPVLETSFRVVFIYSYSLTTLFVSSDKVMRFSVDLNRRMLGFAKNASVLRRFIGSGKELMFGVEVGAVCDV